MNTGTYTEYLTEVRTLEFMLDIWLKFDSVNYTKYLTEVRTLKIILINFWSLGSGTYIKYCTEVYTPELILAPSLELVLAYCVLWINCAYIISNCCYQLLHHTDCYTTVISVVFQSNIGPRVMLRDMLWTCFHQYNC